MYSWKNYFPAVISTCEFPILLLRHAYDPSQTNRRNTEDAYLADIQTDLMIECCKFGKIKSIFLPTIDSSSWLNGCAFVTFLKDAEARECAAYLHNRNFERRKLKVCLCLSKEQEEEEHNSSNQFIDIVETKCEESANMIDIEADVESFLNTLL